MDTDLNSEVRIAADLAELIGRQCLAGRPAEIQGAVLADLLATWLIGHRVPGDPEAQAAMREELLQLHIATVRKLVVAADDLEPFE